MILELSKKHPANTFINIDADTFEEICEKYDIESVPTIVVLHAGKEQKRIVGLDTPSLVAFLAAQPQHTHQPIKQHVDEASDAHLRSLIFSHEIMLFIKGTPDAPKCGFSRTAIELLTPMRVKYGTFDILSNTPVREALKIYSQWPTYPQLYVKGELVGGLDILKEMVNMIYYKFILG